MKCPACKKTLREKVAGDITVDVCHGGCGGIWFDAEELGRASKMGAAATLHTIWQSPSHAGSEDGPRMCPRCAEVMERKWFSQEKKIEIDQCGKCSGIWLDDGEFTGIYEETKRGKPGLPKWAVAMADAVTLVKSGRAGA